MNKIRYHESLRLKLSLKFFLHFSTNQICSSLGSVHHHHHHQKCVFLWETEAENILSRSSVSDLTEGGYKRTIGRSPFCYCITVRVCVCVRGTMTYRGLFSHPCKHFYKHTSASCEKHTDTQTQTKFGHTRVGRTV